MLSAAVVGRASLTSQCIDIALDRGLQISVVATADADVRAHAEGLGIAVVDGAADLAEVLAPFQFDVLLSIVNFRIVPDSVLARARTAVNFHDGPLPDYAGRNVTSWALLHGATEHAVTWHTMTAEVDGGDVLVSARFPVAPDDTALTLNARCYEYALATFPQVVDALLAGATPTAQVGGPLRMFARTQRPIEFVDPSRPAAVIARAVRALDVGARLANPVGVVRVVAGDRLLVVTEARAEERPANGEVAPGTLTLERVGDATVARLATVDGDLLVTGFARPDGTALDTAEALGALGVAPGSVLPAPPADLVDHLRAHDPRLAEHEGFWRRRLLTLTADAPVLLEREHADASAATTRRAPPGTTPHDVLTAVAAWLYRLTRSADNAFAVLTGEARRVVGELSPLVAPPFVAFRVTPGATFAALSATIDAECAAIDGHGTFLTDLIGRDPALRGRGLPQVLVEIADGPDSAGPAPRYDLHVRYVPATGTLELSAAVGPEALGRIADQFGALLGTLRDDPASAIDTAPLLGDAELALLDAASVSVRDHDRSRTVDALVLTQAERSPDAPALTAGATTLSYADLVARSGELAAALRAGGIGQGDRVGLALERGVDLVASVLAVLRVGAAYVPLDPKYPVDRLRLMVSDSGLRTLIGRRTDPVVAEIAGEGVAIIEPADLAGGPAGNDAGTDVDVDHAPDDLAYVIYTSGSTGTPKGVMLEHRNVTNFFVGMDDVLRPAAPGVWLAVTSLSFDISVLELLWTLTRGFHVVLHGAEPAPVAPSEVHPGSPAGSPVPVGMSLFYFAANAADASTAYRLVLESATWADRNGFEAVWVPERHFHEFGGAYPNPSVLAAALAATTTRVAIRAGSVVAPLHHPVRIAEEWAIVDNLSGGRVGISFAAGWQPNDFVLNPDAYPDAKRRLPETVDLVRRLWRGEAIEFPGPNGAVATATLPRPVQPELPVWFTSAGSPDTFERAGALGVNLLTHLLGQSVEQLTANIARYRAAWSAAGHPGEGHVTLMVHTYLDRDATASKRVAREPLKRYLSSATGLIRNMASAFPTFANAGADADAAFASLDERELDELLDVATDRYLDTSGLFGDVAEAEGFARRCVGAGVDEIACLVDFGIDADQVIGGLELLGELHTRTRSLQPRATAALHRADARPSDGESVAALIERWGVTHLQCTPSQMRMLLADPGDRSAVARVGHVLLGGEALPTVLAAELRELLGGRLTNMYGPTETTIWSLTHEIESAPSGTVPIGRPIANTVVRVLDPMGQRVPIGVDGELHLAGEGVARGYHARPELTAERFVERPGIGRTYATGDIAHVRADGTVLFSGRADLQVKVRGHRIELGEIEAALDGHPGVTQAIALAQTAPGGEVDLIAAYVGEDVPESALREHLAERMPAAYVPSAFVRVTELPTTPNGKVDRVRLLADAQAALADRLPRTSLASSDPLQRLVADEWAAELRRPVGLDDNVFEIGGNSLAAVAVFRRLGQLVTAPLALTDLFRYPTVRTLAAHLSNGQSPDPADDGPSEAVERGARRRRAMGRRG